MVVEYPFSPRTTSVLKLNSNLCCGFFGAKNVVLSKEHQCSRKCMLWLHYGYIFCYAGMPSNRSVTEPAFYIVISGILPRADSQAEKRINPFSSFFPKKNLKYAYCFRCNFTKERLWGVFLCWRTSKKNSQCSAFCKAKDVFQEIAGGVLWPKKGFG